eukprot:tig00000158_g10131.t1
MGKKGGGGAGGGQRTQSQINKQKISYLRRALARAKEYQEREAEVKKRFLGHLTQQNVSQVKSLPALLEIADFLAVRARLEPDLARIEAGEVTVDELIPPAMTGARAAGTGQTGLTGADAIRAALRNLLGLWKEIRAHPRFEADPDAFLKPRGFSWLNKENPKKSRSLCPIRNQKAPLKSIADELGIDTSKWGTFFDVVHTAPCQGLSREQLAQTEEERAEMRARAEAARRRQEEEEELERAARGDLTPVPSSGEESGAWASESEEGSSAEGGSGEGEGETGGEEGEGEEEEEEEEGRSSSSSSASSSSSSSSPSSSSSASSGSAGSAFPPDRDPALLDPALNPHLGLDGYMRPTYEGTDDEAGTADELEFNAEKGLWESVAERAADRKLRARLALRAGAAPQAPGGPPAPPAPPRRPPRPPPPRARAPRPPSPSPTRGPPRPRPRLLELAGRPRRPRPAPVRLHGRRPGPRRLLLFELRPGAAPAPAPASSASDVDPLVPRTEAEAAAVERALRRRGLTAEELRELESGGIRPRPPPPLDEVLDRREREDAARAAAAARELEEPFGWLWKTERYDEWLELMTGGARLERPGFTPVDVEEAEVQAAAETRARRAAAAARARLGEAAAAAAAGRAGRRGGRRAGAEPAGAAGLSSREAPAAGAEPPAAAPAEEEGAAAGSGGEGERQKKKKKEKQKGKGKEKKLPRHLDPEGLTGPTLPEGVKALLRHGGLYPEFFVGLSGPSSDEEGRPRLDPVPATPEEAAVLEEAKARTDEYEYEAAPEPGWRLSPQHEAELRAAAGRPFEEFSPALQDAVMRAAVDAARRALRGRADEGVARGGRAAAGDPSGGWAAGAGWQGYTFAGPKMYDDGSEEEEAKKEEEFPPHSSHHHCGDCWRTFLPGEIFAYCRVGQHKPLCLWCAGVVDAQGRPPERPWDHLRWGEARCRTCVARGRPIAAGAPLPCDGFWAGAVRPVSLRSFLRRRWLDEADAGRLVLSERVYTETHIEPHTFFDVQVRPSTVAGAGLGLFLAGEPRRGRRRLGAANHHVAFGVLRNLEVLGEDKPYAWEQDLTFIDGGGDALGGGFAQFANVAPPGRPANAQLRAARDVLGRPFFGLFARTEAETGALVRCRRPALRLYARHLELYDAGLPWDAARKRAWDEHARRVILHANALDRLSRTGDMMSVLQVASRHREAVIAGCPGLEAKAYIESLCFVGRTTLAEWNETRPVVQQWHEARPASRPRPRAPPRAEPPTPRAPRSALGGARGRPHRPPRRRTAELANIAEWLEARKEEIAARDWDAYARGPPVLAARAARAAAAAAAAPVSSVEQRRLELEQLAAAKSAGYALRETVVIHDERGFEVARVTPRPPDVKRLPEAGPPEGFPFPPPSAPVELGGPGRAPAGYVPNSFCAVPAALGFDPEAVAALKLGTLYLFYGVEGSGEYLAAMPPHAIKVNEETGAVRHAGPGYLETARVVAWCKGEPGAEQVVPYPEEGGRWTPYWVTFYRNAGPRGCAIGGPRSAGGRGVSYGPPDIDAEIVEQGTDEDYLYPFMLEMLTLAASAPAPGQPGGRSRPAPPTERERYEMQQPTPATPRAHPPNVVPSREAVLAQKTADAMRVAYAKQKEAVRKRRVEKALKEERAIQYFLEKRRREAAAAPATAPRRPSAAQAAAEEKRRAAAEEKRKREDEARIVRRYAGPQLLHNVALPAQPTRRPPRPEANPPAHIVGEQWPNLPPAPHRTYAYITAEGPALASQPPRHTPSPGPTSRAAARGRPPPAGPAPRRRPPAPPRRCAARRPGRPAPPPRPPRPAAAGGQ